MRVEPNIAPVAALFGEPSRAAILTVLLDGRALPAGELAGVAGINPTAASGHLSKLVTGGLLAVEVDGRHRFYRLANPTVATVIEDLAQLSGRPAIFNLPQLSPSARALRQARTCYDHLAGQLAVAIAATLESRGWLVRGEGKRYEIGSEAGRQWFANQGINFQTIKPGRYGLARQCLDWTERRPHLASLRLAATQATARQTEQRAGAHRTRPSRATRLCQERGDADVREVLHLSAAGGTQQQSQGFRPQQRSR